MMEQPLISVIVPCYRVEPYLAKCVESLLCQTHTNLEIILIDDGSPDRCGQLCDSYAARDPRVTVIHQDNAGVSAARNAGLAASHGGYIGFADPDDWTEPALYETLLACQLQGGKGLSVCGHSLSHPEGWEEPRSYPQLRGTIGLEQALTYVMQESLFEGYLWNKLFSRSLLEQAGGGSLLRFEPEIHVCEDLLYVCRCILAAGGLCYAPQSLYHYLVREGSAIYSYNEKRRSELLARQQIIDLVEPVSPRLGAMARARYVDTAVNLVRFAARDRDRGSLPGLRREVRRYRREYFLSPSVPAKAKIRTVAILLFPSLSHRIWIFLKSRFHLTWIHHEPPTGTSS